MFALIAVGVFARRLGCLSREADAGLLKLVLWALLPSLIFSSVRDNPAIRETSNLLWPAALGMVVIGTGFAAGAIVARLSPRVTGLDTAARRRTFAICVGFINFTFVPIPLVKTLFDDRTLGVLFLHNVGAALTAYAIGVVVLAGHGRGWWKALLNGPMLATLVGVGVNLLGLAERVPSMVVAATDSLGQAAIPMALLVVGATLADEHRSGNAGFVGSSGMKITAWAILLRLGLLPMVTLLLAITLPVSIELQRVLVVMAAMPSATVPILLARHYGAAPGVAVKVALGTSVLSLATIPLWITLGLRLTGLE